MHLVFICSLDMYVDGLLLFYRAFMIDISYIITCLSQGNCIQTVNGKSEVFSNEIAVREGLYTIITEVEYIVVNDVVASPFAVNHYFTNKYYDILRLIHKYAPFLSHCSLMKSVHTVANDISLVYMTFFSI